MSNQEFENAIGLFVITCIGITVIWSLLKCVSWLFSEPQQQYQYVPTYSSESSFIENRRINEGMATQARQERLIRRPKQVIAIDTECVATGARGNISMVARVSLVRRDGKVYDKYVKPTAPVTDYRTFVSGIRSIHLVDAEDYYQVRQEVAHILKGSILVGHDVQRDLDSLELTHPTEDVRDTATFELFREIYFVNHDIYKDAMARKWMNTSHYDAFEMTYATVKALDETRKSVPKNQKLSLKWLTKHLLKRDIQVGQHNSVEDARAALDLYLLYEKTWEAQIF